MDSSPQQSSRTSQQSAAPHLSLHWDSHWSARLRKFTLHGSELLELVVAGVVLIGLLFSLFPLIRCMPGLLIHGNDVEVGTFLEWALDIVIGVEFIKMLLKHSPGSSLQVLLCAIARHMVVGHNSAMENLLSVAAIALLFIVRKYFFVPTFGTSLAHSSHAEETAPGQSLLQLFHKKKNEPEKPVDAPIAAPAPLPVPESEDEDEEEDEEDELEEPEEDEEEADEDDCEVGELKIHC